MKRLVVGLMSGTSMDGIDAALGEVTGSGESCRFRPLGFVTTPYPKQIREELLEIGRSKDHGSNLAKISSLNYRLGELFAQAGARAAPQMGRCQPAVGLIWSHRQTV